MARPIQIIVCETTGIWAAALRRGLPPGVLVTETRSISEIWQRLRDSSVAVLMLELAVSRAEQSLAAVLRLNRINPHVAVLVLAERELALLEDVFREAGAAHFITSPRRIDEVLWIVQRRHQHTDTFSLTDAAVPIEDRILASLPWGE